MARSIENAEKVKLITAALCALCREHDRGPHGGFTVGEICYIIRRDDLDRGIIRDQLARSRPTISKWLSVAESYDVVIRTVFDRVEFYALTRAKSLS